MSDNNSSTPRVKFSVGNPCSSSESEIVPATDDIDPIAEEFVGDTDKLTGMRPRTASSGTFMHRACCHNQSLGVWNKCIVVYLSVRNVLTDFMIITI